MPRKIGKPKRVFFVALDGPHADGVRLGYGRKGGGLYSLESEATRQTEHLRKQGFGVNLYVADIEWRRVDSDEELAENLVDAWNRLPDDGVSLHDFMRVSWDEYKTWVEGGGLPADFEDRHP